LCDQAIFPELCEAGLAVKSKHLVIAEAGLLAVIRLRHMALYIQMCFD